jgi:hypothetical protein
MSHDSPDPIQTTSGEVSSRRGPGTVFWVFLTFVVAGLIVFFTFVRMTNHAVTAVKDTVVGVAEIFKPDVVITTFSEWRELKISPTDGNILEIATAESSERFMRKTNLAMFGKVLPLTTTVSEITVPATYRFHIDLDDEWNITSDGKRLIVRAPKVSPSLPVAFDTAGVEKKTQAGWARWDGKDDLDALEKEITGKLEERARQPKTLSKVSDEARTSVARFIQKWLVDQNAWGTGRFEEIVVLFSDEQPDDVSTVPAAIRFGNSLPQVLP